MSNVGLRDVESEDHRVEDTTETETETEEDQNSKDAVLCPTWKSHTTWEGQPIGWQNNDTNEAVLFFKEAVPPGIIVGPPIGGKFS